MSISYDYVQQSGLQLACTGEQKMFATEQTSKMWFRLHCKKCRTCKEATKLYLESIGTNLNRPRYSERVVNNTDAMWAIGNQIS